MKKIVKTLLAILLAIRAISKVVYYRTLRHDIVFMMAGPAHANLGDHAIVYAQKKYVRSVKESSIVEIRLVTGGIFLKQLQLVRKFVRKGDLIMLPGGGNFGDEYPEEEDARRLVIEGFPTNKIIMFPQTMFFKSTEKAQKMLERTREIYSSHTNLTLIAREKVSFEMMRKTFPRNKVLLTPDIVISLRHIEFGLDRVGGMTCLRGDVEKGVTAGKDQEIIDTVISRYGRVNITDTISDKTLILTDSGRRRLLSKKWREFASAEIVVTDRLHGMVFAAITKTPCVVFANYNHKVAGTHEWIKNLEYIRFCDDTAKLSNEMNRAKGRGDVLSYSDEWSQIAEAIRS